MMTGARFMAAAGPRGERLCQRWRKSDEPAYQGGASSATQDMRTRRTQDSSLCKCSQACVGKPRDNLDPSRGAATAQPSPRIVALAKPKKDFSKNQCRPLFLYSCGRESTIWERPLLVNFGLPSDRLFELAEPKKCHPAYLQQRPRQSSEWSVSPAAMNYKATSWIQKLAQPRVLHPEFQPAREVPTQVTNILARSSSRLQRLAGPQITKTMSCYKNIYPEAVIHPVSKFAQEATASPRTLELATAKRLHPDFVPMRGAEWPVTQAAKQAVATPRLVELAQPCKRPPMSFAQFSPDTFTVKETAKRAICSPRTKELAQPVKR